MKPGRRSFYNVTKCNSGQRFRKHEILLENLPITKQQLLKKNNYFKWMKGDTQLFEIIFRTEDMEELSKTQESITWNPYQNNFTTLDCVIDDSKWEDWNCAICKIPIQSRTDKLSISNFVCDTCSESHNKTNKIIDSRIIESSKDFTKHCRLQLKYDQQRYYYYTEKQTRR